jgi:hypothetical protein
MTDLFRRGEVLPEGRSAEEEAKLIGSAVLHRELIHEPSSQAKKVSQP